MACTSICVSPLGSPEKARAIKLAPAASAIAAGLKRGMPVPRGVIGLRLQSGAVVGEACPLVMP